MDIQGNTVGRVNLREGVPIIELSWNCERFNMEEQTDRNSQNNHQQQFPHSQQQQYRKHDLGGALHSSNRPYTTEDRDSLSNINNAAMPCYKPDGKGCLYGTQTKRV